MSLDHVVILIIEAFVIVFVWPNLIQKRELVEHYGLEKDSPNLAYCYRIWRWSVPVFSLIMLGAVYYFRHLFRSETIVVLFFYPLVSVVVGFYIGEIISNHLSSVNRDLQSY